MADLWGRSLFAINVIGAIAYVTSASRGGWVTPQVRELHAEAGEPFIWAIAVLPIWAVFFLINLVWGLLCLTGRKKRLRGFWWLMIIPVWLVAIVIDFAHH